MIGLHMITHYSTRSWHSHKKSSFSQRQLCRKPAVLFTSTHPDNSIQSTTTAASMRRQADCRAQVMAVCDACGQNRLIRCEQEVFLHSSLDLDVYSSIILKVSDHHTGFCSTTRLNYLPCLIRSVLSLNTTIPRILSHCCHSEFRCLLIGAAVDLKQITVVTDL